MIDSWKYTMVIDRQARLILIATRWAWEYMAISCITIIFEHFFAVVW